MTEQSASSEKVVLDKLFDLELALRASLDAIEKMKLKIEVFGCGDVKGEDWEQFDSFHHLAADTHRDLKTVRNERQLGNM